MDVFRRSGLRHVRRGIIIFLLIIAIAFAILDVRSQTKRDGFIYYAPTFSFQLFTYRGRICCDMIMQKHSKAYARESTRFSSRPLSIDDTTGWSTIWDMDHWGFAKFAFFRQDPILPFLISFPLPLLWLGFATPAGIWWFRTRRNRKLQRAGHCVKCGYDLRASPERCPECGTIRK